MGKRARERLREEQREAKRVRREIRAEETTAPDPESEARLMEEFRILSERRASSKVSEKAYETERRRIFAALGIDSE